MDSEPSTLVTEKEIEVALAEAEAQAAEIPSLEAGEAPKVVHIPVEGPPLPKAPTVKAPKSADRAPADRKPEPPVAVEAQLPTSRRHWLRHVPYALVDGLLWVLNRPFRGLPPGARQLVGVLAIVTLVTSLTALLLLPALR